jgi:hypothetical protein
MTPKTCLSVKTMQLVAGIVGWLIKFFDLLLLTWGLMLGVISVCYVTIRDRYALPLCSIPPQSI